MTRFTAILILTCLCAGALLATSSTIPPIPVPVNLPPTVKVSYLNSTGARVSLASSSTIQVGYGTTISSMAFLISIDDPDGDGTSVSTSITNIGSTGMLASEWGSGKAVVPYDLKPTSGTLNATTTTTYGFTMAASDGLNATNVNFAIVQAPPTSNNAPSLSLIWSNGASMYSPIYNGDTVSAPYGTVVSTLLLQLTVDDADGDDVSVSASISNLGNTGMDPTEWEQTPLQPIYLLTPSSGVLNTQAGVTHTFTLTADDGTDQTVFTFYLKQDPNPNPPAIEVTESSNTINSGDMASGTARDFGSRDVGAGASAALQITIKNSGSGDLTLNNFTLTGDAGEFGLDTNGTAGTVTPGSSTTLLVSFDPTSVGSFSAWVVFNHDDPNVSNPFTFEVIGNGTQTATAPLLVVKNGGPAGPSLNYGDLVDFGSIDMSNMPSSDVTIYVENGGTADLTLGAPQLSGSDFVLNAGGATVLNPGASLTFTVSFDALSTGAKTGTVSFSHDDATQTNPFVINLAGTATSSGSGSGSGTIGIGGSGGGGCVAASGTALLWPALLMLFAGVVVVRRRRAA